MQLFAASRGAASCCPKQAQLAHNSTSQAMPASAGVLVMSDSACTGLQGGQSTHGSDESEAAGRQHATHAGRCDSQTSAHCNHHCKACKAHQSKPSHPLTLPP